MNQDQIDKLELAQAVLDWWKDAQYWTQGDYNVFDQDPDFVVLAQSIIEEAAHV